MKDSRQPSMAPESWDGKTASDNEIDEIRDDSTSESSNSSQSIPLLRHSSLAELSSIATASSPLVNDAKLDSENIFNESNTSNFARDNRISTLALAELDLQFNRKSFSNENMCRGSNTFSLRAPVTPPKEGKCEDPLTPTANLKMLVSAASPAIRDREIKKRELFARPDGEFCLPYMDSKPTFSENMADKTTVSRKDKSLGLLCQRFLSNYPENPPIGEHIEIGLDEVAKNLSVERRRIYDIVNVLESVEVISRYAKNRYVWHGKTRLPNTLARLKASAVSQGFTGKRSVSGKENPECKVQVKKVTSNVQLPRLLPKDPNVLSTSQSSRIINHGQEGVMEEEEGSKKFRDEYCRKDKSLGVLSQKFLMMFLVSETKQVTLEDAANVLIDDAEEGQAKFKTKVRRLYDIANILSSLQLIEKVHIHSLQSGRKPGFRWIGINLDKLEDTNEQHADSSDVHQKSSTVGHTLLPETNWIKHEPLSAVGRLISRRPSQQQLRQSNKMDGSSKCKMPRSRSDRTLMYKKRTHRSNSNDSEEDGYTVQELGDICDVAVRSPTEVKFRSELKKLQEQYPDRMSQLLSACHRGLPESPDTRKSRRTLFSERNECENNSCTGPKAKRPKQSSEQENDVKSFVHSTTSAFRPLSSDGNDKGLAPASGNFQNVTESEKKEIDMSAKELPNGTSSKNCSPEQKIYLERQKQKELLQEQSSFNLQDERWKRIERELEKAFSNCHPVTNISKKFPSFVNQSSSPIPITQLIEHSSIGIQASLIDTISPLKPLSYARKHCKSPWQLAAPTSDLTTLTPVTTVHNTPAAQVTQAASLPARQISPQSSVADNAVLVSSVSQAPLLLPMPSVGQGVVWNPNSHQSTQSSHAVILSTPVYNLSSLPLNSQLPLAPVSSQPMPQSPVEKPNISNPSMPDTVQYSVPGLQPKSVTMVSQLTPTVKAPTINPVTVSAETPSSIAGVEFSGLPRRLSLPVHVQVTSAQKLM